LNVLSIGAGAVGGAVATRLQAAGVDLTVVDTSIEHVRMLRDPGLQVDGIDEGRVTSLDVVIPPSLSSQRVSEADVVLLAVRSGSTARALSKIAGDLRADADVVSLQNGLNEDAIAELVGAERTIGCTVGFGATWISPGHISLDAAGDLTIGRLDGSVAGAAGSQADQRLQGVAELLSKAFPTKISFNIRGDLWAKMLVNSMTVLGALGGMLTGALLATPDRRRFVAEVVAEGVRVAHAEGVDLPNVFGLVPPALVNSPDQWPTVMHRVLVRVGEAYGAIKSVTWRDFELGRKTEIDAVTGEIVRRGELSGVETPFSSAVYAALKEIEAGDRIPAAANLEEIEKLPISRALR
jgi:2-dehydropantoate 2-reductase